jgi:peptide/nickel transport system ATP-binding protein
MSNPVLLQINDLKVRFPTEKGYVTAVDEVSFHINAGETLGIVGESGCGKSVTSQSILKLYDEKMVKYEGEITFNGKSLLPLPLNEMRKIRGNEISMIFQDPMSSLNPVYTVGDQISETIILHQNKTAKEAREIAVEMLKLVGIPSPDKRFYEYPHELSGGMRQRVMIAMALSCKPKLLIADEPTTALDVTIQSQILDLMTQLKKDLGMGIILITHDLGVVAEVCSRVVVMYLGQIIEDTDVNTLFSNPLHPYTIGLIKSIPQINGNRNEKLHVIQGIVPSLHNVPMGCRFAPRCPFADELCTQQLPNLEEAENNHKVRCWHYEKIAKMGGDNYVISAK